jgi:hypothetical protein
MGKINYMYAFGEKHQAEKLTEIPKCRWDDNIKTNLENTITGKETDSSVSGEKQVAGFCEQGNEPRSIKCGIFLIS